MIALEAALEFAHRHWKAVAGGIAILGILIALGITRHTLANRTAQLGIAKQQLANEIAKNKIDLASIQTLQYQIGQQNAAVEGMVAESNARLKAGSDALAAAQRTRGATESAVQSLRASSGRTVAKDAPCVASEAWLQHSGEL